ncbi:CAP Gly-rich domain-containing protein [Rozella allomycis CSF55]|uniref:CAP Gly-rich domain-containing protein n=1 Tax=Rozella allomycis (strain CSF55) TaxID=988480 RepID=A0A075ART6_ROZAC|nr:CAP Gly-rich domain-containing protein [Rozella allomycis CSF55]|eukprot:EPZ32953.1 CAP Gly-rich domain-containing protein [Rozella allomycis CSF55]
MDLEIGQRVLLGNNLEGVIRYVGNADFATGIWVGIELDEPTGKNNGTVQGTQYFVCEDKHGIFVRPAMILKILGDGEKEGNMSKPDVAVSENAKRTSASVRDRHSVGPIRTSVRPSITARDISQRNSMPPVLPRTSIGRTSPVEKSITSADSIQKRIVNKSELIENRRSSTSPKTDDEEINKMREQISIERENARVIKEELKKYVRMSQESEDARKRIEERLAKVEEENRKLKEEMLDSQGMDQQEMLDTIEILTLDKEVAEEKYEAALEEIERLKKQTEEKKEFKETNLNEINIDEIILENDMLREALARLDEMSKKSNQENLERIQQLEEKTFEFERMRNENEKNARELREKEEMINQLKEDVDAAVNAEMMISELTEKNFNLERIE